MHTQACEMCDKENTKLSDRDWCDACEDLFKRVMATVRCANKSTVCTTPYSCLSAKKCMQVRTVTITSSQVYETRNRLMKAKERGLIGVIAGHTKIPEFALRDWIDNPSHFLTQVEMQTVIEALDRYIPQQSTIERTSAL